MIADCVAGISRIAWCFVGDITVHAMVHYGGDLVWGACA